MTHTHAADAIKVSMTMLEDRFQATQRQQRKRVIMSRQSSWIVPPKLWSNWDQTCAQEAGWHIHFDNVEWRISQCLNKSGYSPFGTDEHAARWVAERADMGSTRHQRAINAMIAANLSGHTPP